MLHPHPRRTPRPTPPRLVVGEGRRIPDVFVGFPGTLSGFWHTWISPSEFSGSYLLTVGLFAFPLPGVPPSSLGMEASVGRRGVNACVCLRGAAALLRPGRLLPVRRRVGQSQLSAPSSAVSRGDGKLAVIWPPRRKASENGLEQVGTPFLSCPYPNSLRGRKLG